MLKAKSQMELRIWSYSWILLQILMYKFLPPDTYWQCIVMKCTSPQACLGFPVHRLVVAIEQI